MTKYILSSREFRDEFITQIHEISDEYQFIHYDKATQMSQSRLAGKKNGPESYWLTLLLNGSKPFQPVWIPYL